MKDKILTVSINQCIVSSIILIIGIMLGFLFGHSGCYGKSFDDLELNNRLLKPCRKKPNCVSSQSVNPKDQIQPMHFFGSIKSAKKKSKPYRLNDSNGLYLWVAVSGTKSWQYRYQVSENGKRKDVNYTIGTYPSISLAQARAEQQILKSEVSQGVNVHERKLQLRKPKPKTAEDFAAVYDSIYEPTKQDPVNFKFENEGTQIIYSKKITYS